MRVCKLNEKKRAHVLLADVIFSRNHFQDDLDQSDWDMLHFFEYKKGDFVDKKAPHIKKHRRHVKQQISGKIKISSVHYFFLSYKMVKWFVLKILGCFILAIAVLVSSADMEETAPSNFDETAPMERGVKLCGGKSIIGNIF